MNIEFLDYIGEIRGKELGQTILRDLKAQEIGRREGLNKLLKMPPTL